MKSIHLIRWALQMTDEATAKLVADMRDAPLTQPTSRGGNHPPAFAGEQPRNS